MLTTYTRSLRTRLSQQATGSSNGQKRRLNETEPEAQNGSEREPSEKRVCHNNRRTVLRPRNNTVLAPYNYVAALPSKKVREVFIQGLNTWFNISTPILQYIIAIVNILHQSSLMFDDIEDESKLRRGKPAAHMLYGTAQTINSGVYALVDAFAEVRNLHNPDAMDIFIDEMKNLHCGQSFDLYWKYHGHIPSVDDYMMMVDNKTGGLFRLCVRLMQGESDNPDIQSIDIEKFVHLLGRFFQIRDDYQNLTSAEYSYQKGFCEDLDEGKVSLPLIYYMQNLNAKRDEIKSLLFHRSSPGEGLALEMKEFILEEMKGSGALDQTLVLLRGIQDDLVAELRKLEVCFREKNPTLGSVLEKLRV